MIEIDYVHFVDKAMIIGWSGDIGFGVLTIYQEDDEFKVETECLGSDFYYKILDKLKEYLQKVGQIVE